jgi:hypothetical protein
MTVLGDDPFDYCREIEAYLCKKNEGHLIRIVGPAFEMVRGWGDQGIPLKVALRGIERTCDRHNAKPGRRRPLRIEFCEADVLEEFDAWRRATGVATATASEATDDKGAPGNTGNTGGTGVVDAPRARKEPLAAHIERAVSKLLALRLNGNDAAFAAVIGSTVAALDELVQNARNVRGDARVAIVARLAELDASLVTAARAHVNEKTAEALLREADAELAPFAARMPAEGRERARDLAFVRLLRDELGLPVLTYE